MTLTESATLAATCC